MAARHRQETDRYDEDDMSWVDGFSAGKRTERLSAQYEAEYNRIRRPNRGNGPAWVMAAIMLCAALAFGAYILVDMFPKGDTAAIADPAPSGAIGRQAPPAAVRRAPAATVGQSSAPDVQTAIDQYNQAQEQQAVNAAPALAALPLNSQGEPVIDAYQQAQQQQSLQLAEQEGAAAVDQQLAADRAAANAEALSRPPDVSKEEAEAMMHRDLCSVPRANPATCAQGLYKPTPVR